MSRTKCEFRWFTIPQYDKEQDYLSKMHQSGWKLTRISFPGFYHFEECIPEDVVYQLDYNQDGIAHKAEYMQIFKDCGWEYLFDYVGYSYFRKVRDNSQCDDSIFCDDASRLEMMQRVFKGRVVPLIILFFGVIIPQLFLQMNRSGRIHKFLLISYLIIFFLYAVLFGWFGYQFYQYELKVLDQPEKTKPKFYGVLAVLLVLSLIVGVFGFQSIKGRESVYTLSERKDGYSISAEYLDEYVERQFDLVEGDEIWVNISKTSGDFALKIGCEGKEPIFTSNGAARYVSVTVQEPVQYEFSVIVQEPGCYIISCDGTAAEGSVDFTIK